MRKVSVKKHHRYMYAGPSLRWVVGVLHSLGNFFFVKRGFFWPFRDALSANFQTLSANKGWLIKINGKLDLNTLPLPLSKIASDDPVCMTYTPDSRA